jgi:hypothetical protein
VKAIQSRVQGITDSYEGTHDYTHHVQTITFGSDFTPMTSIDDVMLVKNNVTSCLIELRESKEQNEKLLISLNKWFADSGKKVS